MNRLGSAATAAASSFSSSSPSFSFPLPPSPPSPGNQSQKMFLITAGSLISYSLFLEHSCPTSSAPLPWPFMTCFSSPGGYFGIIFLSQSITTARINVWGRSPQVLAWKCTQSTCSYMRVKKRLYEGHVICIFSHQSILEGLLNEVDTTLSQDNII